MAKLLSSMLYQAVGGKIILGWVTFLGFVTLPIQGNFTQTDVVYIKLLEFAYKSSSVSVTVK